MTVRDDINALIRDGTITGYHFLHLHDYKPVLDKLAKAFLARGRADLRYIWLWEPFREPTKGFQVRNTLTILEEILKPTSRYWFVASDQNGKYWVADATGEAVASLLSSMYFFEYYFSDREMTWLIAENHHEMLIGLGVLWIGFA